MCDFLSGVLLPFRLSGTDNPFSSRLAALVVAVDGVGAGAGICAVSVFSGCWYQWCLRSVVVGVGGVGTVGGVCVVSGASGCVVSRARIVYCT